MSIAQAAEQYVIALRAYSRSFDFEQGLQLSRATDCLLAAFAQGVPDEFLSEAFESYRRSMLWHAGLLARAPIGGKA